MKLIKDYILVEILKCKFTTFSCGQINKGEQDFFTHLSLCSFWDLSSQTRHRIQAPGSEGAESNHWTTKEFPKNRIFD